MKIENTFSVYTAWPCTYGYEWRKGTIPGKGEISTTYIDHLDECAIKCTNEPECNSFQYEKATKACKLHKVLEPTKDEEKEGVDFCTKYWGGMDSFKKSIENQI